MSLLSTSSQWIKRHSWVSAVIVMLLLAGVAYLHISVKIGGSTGTTGISFLEVGRTTGLFIDMFSIDRPFIGWNYTFFYLLLGGNVLYWNIAAFFLRFAGGLGFLCIIRRLWPSKSQAGLVMGALFIIYPGFMQQSNAITYITHLTYTLMLIVSLLFMVIAIKSKSILKKSAFTIISLVSLIYYFLLSEYVVGIEGLRFALIAYLVTRDHKDMHLRSKALLVLKNYWPYLLTVTGLLLWRLVFFHSERPTTDINGLLESYLSAHYITSLRLQ